jgi:hypothetical protein
MLDELGEKLRLALKTGRFDTALPLIDEYGKAVRHALRATHDHDEKEEILNEASSFLRDHLHLARILRSHLSARLTANSRLSSYNDLPGIKSTWNFEA